MLIPKYLVVHHSASANNITVDDIRRWHKDKGWSDIAYHKVIYQDGSINQGRNDAVQGAHAFGANAVSLGICLIGNFETNELPEVMKKALIQTLATLCKRYNIPSKNIIGHYQVAKMFNAPAGASGCPGKNVIKLLSEIKKEVEKYL